MFGSVMVCLEQYMKERIGNSGWEIILANVGLEPDKTYRTVYFYPDKEFEALLKDCAAMTGMSISDLQRDLGRTFGRFLLKTYSRMFFPSWRALEVIEKAAPKVFNTIQLIDPYTPKSSVKTERVSPEEVIVYYQSPRQMCSYIMGIIDAMGMHFNEKLEVRHTTCMHKGDPLCEIHVTLV